MNESSADIRVYREAVRAQLSKDLGGRFVDRLGRAQDHVLVEHGNGVVTLEHPLNAVV